MIRVTYHVSAAKRSRVYSGCALHGFGPSYGLLRVFNDAHFGGLPVVEGEDGGVATFTEFCFGFEADVDTESDDYLVADGGELFGIAGAFGPSGAGFCEVSFDCGAAVAGGASCVLDWLDPVDVFGEVEDGGGDVSAVECGVGGADGFDFGG
jgi:hypothetical protein